MIPICMVYESPHKRQCDKALILIFNIDIIINNKEPRVNRN